MDRFWSKVDKSGDCWIWTRGKDDFGYGQFKFNGKNIKAHRVSYYLTHNKWPDYLRHSCDNPSCVNPSHLLVGTAKDNVDDMIERGRHNWPLSDSQVQEIRGMEYDNTIVARVAEQYDVSYHTARAVLSGASYKHIECNKQLPRQKSRRKLSDQEVQDIKQIVAQPYHGMQTVLAAEYGVSRNVIQRIQYGTY